MVLGPDTHWHVVAYRESGSHEVCPICFDDLDIALEVAEFSEPYWPGYSIHVEEVEGSIDEGVQPDGAK